MNRRVPLLCLILTCLALLPVPALQAETTASEPETQVVPVEEENPARVTLTGMDYPDYAEDIGALTLPDSSPEVLAETDPQYLRLSLVDVEELPYLPKGWQIYQVVTTGVPMPVSIHFIVDRNERAWCFNPEIPYCSEFKMLDRWLGRGAFIPEDLAQAGSLARFVVELGISTVHHPRDFLFLRLQQQFGVEHFNFIQSIEEIYLPDKARYRSEAEQEEYETMTERYGERIKRMVVEENDLGWRLHGFTYKIMRSSGQLREWTVQVKRDGSVEVNMEILEENIGELFFSWAG